MNARKVAEYAADQIVMTVVAAAAMKLSLNVAPEFVESHPKVTKISCGTIGFAVSNHVEDDVHIFVNNVFDKLETRRSNRKK